MQQDVNVLARTLYGESEVGDVDDLKAIASVVMNRVALPNWPENVRDVCLEERKKGRHQFSCWDKDYKRLPLMKTVTREDEWFDQCWHIAQQASDGALHDPTARSTHYHNDLVEPWWAEGKVPVHSTPWGNRTHYFYNDIDTDKPSKVKNPFLVSEENRISKTMVVNAIVAVASIAALFLPELAPFADPQHVESAGWIGTATSVANMILRRVTSGRIKPENA